MISISQKKLNQSYFDLLIPWYYAFITEKGKLYFPASLISLVKWLLFSTFWHLNIINLINGENWNIILHLWNKKGRTRISICKYIFEKNIKGTFTNLWNNRYRTICFGNIRIQSILCIHNIPNVFPMAQGVIVAITRWPTAIYIWASRSLVWRPL